MKVKHTLQRSVEVGLPSYVVEEMEQFLKEYYETYGRAPHDVCVRVNGKARVVPVVEVRDEWSK